MWNIYDFDNEEWVGSTRNYLRNTEYLWLKWRQREWNSHFSGRMINGQHRRRVVGNCLTHSFETQCFKYVCTLLKKYTFLWRKLSFHIVKENPREKLVNWDAVRAHELCPLLKSYMCVYIYICMYIFIFPYLPSVKGSSNNGKKPWTKTQETWVHIPHMHLPGLWPSSRPEL